MRRPGRRFWWRSLLAICVLAFVGDVVVGLVIGAQVRGAADAAVALHPGTDVHALLAVATDDAAPLRERNRAVWALGQLGCPEVLPVLRSLATSQECDHEAALCQREVRKAIAGCEGGFNAAAWVWRHGRFDPDAAQHL